MEGGSAVMKKFYLFKKTLQSHGVSFLKLLFGLFGGLFIAG
jgi:hypothetical protein